MTTVAALRRVPQTKVEWDRFHFEHFRHHKLVLGVVEKKTSTTLFMPPLYPIPDNVYTAKISQWHQILHQQMDSLSGDTLFNFLYTDLSTPEGQRSFVETNFKNHWAFQQLVGVPI